MVDSGSVQFIDACIADPTDTEAGTIEPPVCRDGGGGRRKIGQGKMPLFSKKNTEVTKSTIALFNEATG